MFNAAAYFVDRHIEEGRESRIAIECGDRRLTYRELFEQVNRIGNALRAALDVRPEERVLLLMCDGPEMIAAFFGAIKIGAVPVPLNTRWTAADYEFVLRDSSARVIITSAELLDAAAAAIANCKSLRHVVVLGQHADSPPAGAISFEALVTAASPTLETEPTSVDAPAFWLYSSGSTGQPKACVHLQHDMTVCADAYARGVLGIHEDDRCFSVAKLFFAYGLGNSMYFPFAVGATTILWPGAVAAPTVLRDHRALSSHAALLRADSLRDAAGAYRARARSSTCRASGGRVRRRGAAAGDVRAISRTLRRRDSRRHRLDRGPAHLHLQPTGSRSRRARAASSCPATRHASSTRHGQPVPAGELGDLVVQRRLDLCLLLESATSRRRTRSADTGSGPATSTARTRTASSGSRAARTTCSRSAGSG